MPDGPPLGVERQKAPMVVPWGPECPNSREDRSGTRNGDRWLGTNGSIASASAFLGCRGLPIRGRGIDGVWHGRTPEVAIASTKEAFDHAGGDNDDRWARWRHAGRRVGRAAHRPTAFSSATADKNGVSPSFKQAVLPRPGACYMERAASRLKLRLK